VSIKVIISGGGSQLNGVLLIGPGVGVQDIQRSLWLILVKDVYFVGDPKVRQGSTP